MAHVSTSLHHQPVKATALLAASFFSRCFGILYFHSFHTSQKPLHTSHSAKRLTGDELSERLERMLEKAQKEKTLLVK